MQALSQKEAEIRKIMEMDKKIFTNKIHSVIMSPLGMMQKGFPFKPLLESENNETDYQR